MTDDDFVFRYNSREEVCVERTVSVWGCFDDTGAVDGESGKWRRRTVAEFARAIIQAADDLDDPFADARENHGSGEVVVYGNRPANTKEVAEYDRRDKIQWLAAKGTYDRGRATYEGNPA